MPVCTADVIMLTCATCTLDYHVTGITQKKENGLDVDFEVNSPFSALSSFDVKVMCSFCSYVE